MLTPHNHSVQAAELVKRQAATKDAVIVFSSRDFDEFATVKGRDYHLMFFLNANHLASNSQMNLPKLRQEFTMAAQVSIYVTQ